MRRLLDNGWIAFIAFVAVACLAIGMAAGQVLGNAPAMAEHSARQAGETAMSNVSDVPFAEAEAEPTYEFNAEADLQNPELPTGCEATAMSVVLRMNGVEVSKTEFADAMPKGDGEDFVHEFWGDPYSEHGWACMAPCAVDTAKRFTPVEKTVVDLTGTPLVYLPAPCAVWVTMGLQDPIPSRYEQDGYKLMWNPHCVALLSVGEATVRVIDPLEGVVTYPFSRFDAAYTANGMQAAYIADRGYTPDLS